MVGKEKASLSRASMGRAWQPVGDASWDAEAEARRRGARRMQAIGSWVRGPARMQPARRLPLRQAPNESVRRARRVSRWKVTGLSSGFYLPMSAGRAA